MMKIRVCFLSLFILLLHVFTSYGQTNQIQIQKIDSLFTSWNSPNHPGGAVLVSKDGKTIFSKSYGLANIEYNIPNSNHTLFNIGSISKQFTAMGIVLLEEQNKLSFDDDIKKYIPELPSFGETITIRHLLQHTSGMRDLHGLLGLAGWRSGDLETNDDVYRIINNQKELNFKPGEEFLYSNTGYILLAKIIENISQLKFDQWMKQNIFHPLGMKNTYVETSLNKIVANNATSYYLREEFERALEYWGYFGSGNIHSTIEDLNIWLQNFSTPKNNWETAFKKLLSTTPLHNGFETNYGFGVRIEEYSGRKVIQHGGSVGGFRALARTFPEEQLNIVILTNYSRSNIGSKANKISDILLNKKNNSLTKTATTSTELPAKFIRLTKQRLEEFEGVYWSASEKSGRKVYIKNDTLQYSSSAGNQWPLLPIGKHTFIMNHPSIKPMVKFDSITRQMIITTENNLPGIFTFLQSNLDITTNGNNILVGKYYSPELKTMYSISIDDNSNIYLEHARHGILKLEQLYNTIFSGDWPVGTVEIKKNEKGKVMGLRMSNGRTRNVWFKKIR
ncbi:serine hydrolase domain-containing protein [Flagellimonas okinawensis]|uniref:Serine hydrolase n=1 Tax=Flagellimonas okinawensis TaxID=3031324 RepID=A0ABT5XRF9_9FLAO|nr:serine hydrolase domain-containing protein [[Muricauda] okinawensis]MDF0708487.1 serine hydrolase [[Muricauda] okinawensis]